MPRVIGHRGKRITRLLCVIEASAMGHRGTRDMYPHMTCILLPI